MSSAQDNGYGGGQLEPEPTKFFFTEKYARLGVKGNQMPVAAKPVNVELGEWLAHQGEYSYPSKGPAYLT